MAAIDQLEGFPSGQESCVLLVALGSLGDALPLVALADALCGLLARVRVVVSAETYEQLARILGDDASLARVSALSPATGVFGGVADGDAAAAREAAAAAELELVHEAALSLLRGVPQSCRFLGFNAHSAHAFHVAEAVRAAPVLCAPTVEPSGDERSGWAAGLAAPWYAPWRRTKRVWRGRRAARVWAPSTSTPGPRARGSGAARRSGAAVYGGGAPAPSKRRAAGWEWAAARGEESALVPAGAVPSPRSASAFTSRASRTASRAPSTGSRRPSRRWRRRGGARARAAGGAAAPSAALGLPLDPALAAACAMLFDGATATTLCSYAAERARRRAAWLDRKAAAGLYLSRRMPPGTSVEVAAFCAFLFVPRPAYGGRRPGAVFRAGDRGVGYYPDPY
ncbi:hypothetical protein SO694_00009345 [Aureococcus anophagefferens]|uniref:Glycosyltransferase family 28 N-terminal domain-containing protein n=1 Tax=Aureococcus anophagefferens TaxID=44056 RepID=A0ABR1GET4_AURAN